MAVTVNNGTQTPVVGAETTIATIAGGPLDLVSVYFQGGTGGAGGAIGINVYATINGVPSLAASAQVMGSATGTLVEFADLKTGATGTTSQSPNAGSTFLLDVGGSNYTVKIIDLSTVPIPPGGSARAACTVTLAGVNASDTAASAQHAQAFSPLAVAATGTLTLFAGFLDQMDVAIGLTTSSVPVTVTVTADCGPGSVSAVVRQQTFSGSSVLTTIFRNLVLPVATEYTVAVTNNGTAGVVTALAAITYTGGGSGGGGGGAIPLTGNTNGPSNANTLEAFVTSSTDANVTVSALTTPKGLNYVGFNGLTASRTVFLNTSATGAIGDATEVKDEDGSLAVHNIIIDAGAGKTIDGAQTYTMTSVQNGLKGSVTVRRISNTAWAIV